MVRMNARIEVFKCVAARFKFDITSMHLIAKDLFVVFLYLHNYTALHTSQMDHYLW